MEREVQATRVRGVTAYQISRPGQTSTASYTSAITESRLETLRDKYGIPANVVLVVPGEGDSPLDAPMGFITLYAEFFKVGLRLPLHRFLSRALNDFNVCPAQLNPNSYRSLIGMYILWKYHRSTEMPLGAFKQVSR